MTAPAILPTRTAVERRGDVWYARCPTPLGPYPECLTDRLDDWADTAPDRPFLCRRAAADRHAGPWEIVSYGDARERVRALAQALLDRGLSADRPLVILSGNSIEHALLALAAMACGVPYAPISPAYSLLARDHATLKRVFAALQPGLVFVDDAAAFERALQAAAPPAAEIVCCTPAAAVGTTPFTHLAATRPSPEALSAARRAVSGDTIAKVLYTSGSTGAPKGVINTQRMLCANQEMLRTVLPLLYEEPPVLCDWLPWNHTFGGNHNFGIVLYNGGTLYIDDGRPTPEGFAVTRRNLAEIPTTAYFNVPRGYELLVPELRRDTAFRDRFFSRVRMLFCAAAALRQQVADDLDAAAREARGDRIPLVTGLGATESAPFALCAGDSDFTGGRIGVPVPGVELKLVPVGDKYEGRLRGPNITPGYWRDPELTRAAFDEEGFYRLGDALRFVDEAEPDQGFVFEGRLSEDFKLSTGTWVRVGPLRAALLAVLGELAQDVVLGGHDRDYVIALIFARPAPLEAGVLRARIIEALREFAAEHRGSSTAVRRAVVLDEPPALDAGELTDKGSVNQKAVLKKRAAVVERVFDGAGDDIIRIAEEQPW